MAERIFLKEDCRVLSWFETSDEAAILQSLDDGRAPGRRDASGRTLLHLAATHGLAGVAQELIRRGADVEWRDFHDRTALMLAAGAGADSVVELLIAAGAKPGVPNTWGRTDLMYASHGLHPTVVKKLLDYGASPHTVDRTGRSARDYLWMRRASRDQKRCAELLERALNATPAPPATPANRSKQPEPVHERPRFTVTAGTAALSGPTRWLNGHPLLAGCLVSPWALPGLVGVMMAVLSLPIGTLLLVILLGIWAKIIRPSIVDFRRKSKLPALPDPSPHEASAVPVALEPRSPMYVSSMLHLGSHTLEGIHRRTPRVPPPGFEYRMRLTHARSIALGLVVSVLIIVAPIVISGEPEFPLLRRLLAPGRPFIVGVILLAIVVLTYALESRNRTRRARELQNLEDTLAQRISQQLVSELAQPSEDLVDYGLYLRSFRTTGLLKVRGVDLETQIAHSINATLPIVALGRPGEHVGAGRIQTSDEQWREEILRLMAGARIILVIPSHRPGTLWEIEQLRDRGYLERTIFIMPPDLRMKGEALSAEWNLATEAVADLGFEIPRHFSKGLFFSVDRTGAFQDHAPFSMVEFFDDALKRQPEAFEDRAEPSEESNDPLDIAVAAAILGKAVADDVADVADDVGDAGGLDGWENYV